MFEERLKNLIIEKYGSVRQFSFKIDVPYTTVDSILKRGIDNSNVGNVIKICKALNISIDTLLDNKDIVRANDIIKDNNLVDDKPINELDQYKILFDKDSRLTPEQKEFFIDMIETQHRKFDEAQENGNVN